MAKPKIKHTITKKEWDNKHKDFKLMGKDGIPYIMAYDSKIGTHLVPVKIVKEEMDESVGAELDLIKQSSKDVKDFIKKVFRDSDFRAMKNDKDFVKYLKSMYEGIEPAVNEGFKSEYKGNDGIVWKKGNSRGGVTNFTPYYKGHNIDFGGHNFKTEKELKDFIKDYILSRDQYHKYRFESVNEGKKRFYQQDRVGSAKYTISYHDGKQKHKDGSDFYGIQIFRNKKDLEKFRTELLKKGYREDSGFKKESVNEAKEPEVITQLRKIVKDKQNSLVVDTKSKKKVRVDMNSANLMVQVYDKLRKQSNKDKFVKSGIVAMGHMAYKLMRNESVNEVNYDDSLADFNKELEKTSGVKKAAKHYNKSTKEVVKALQTKIKVNRYSDKSIKKISIDYKEDGTFSSKASIKLSKSYKQNESVNESIFSFKTDNIEQLHFETNPKKAELMKIELGKSQGEINKRKQIESGEYSLRLFRKKIKYGNGKDVGVFLPGSYDAVTSKLGDGPHKKAVKKVKWTQKKYDQWLEDMASNGGARNAFDMAQNAKNEPGLIDWVKKNFRGDKPLQRIQWDIEGFNESVNEAYVVLHSPKKGVKPVATAAYADKKDAEKWAKDLGGITMIVKKKMKGIDEAKGDLQIYHKSYTLAIEEAKRYAYLKGYTIADDELFTKVGLNSKRPSVGKTTRVSLELLKKDKPQRKMLHIQVYGMKNMYELNAYIN
jgi:hypothetical protein